LSTLPLLPHKPTRYIQYHTQFTPYSLGGSAGCDLQPAVAHTHSGLTWPAPESLP